VVKPFRPDYLLWALLTLGFAGLLAVAPEMGVVFRRPLTQLAAGDWREQTVLAAAVVLTGCYLPPAMVAGWFAHRLLVRWGLRLTGHPSPTLADDFEDAPPPTPPAG
jgi:hypothetical protein